MTNPTAEGEEGLRHEPAPADGPWSKVRGPLAAGSIAVALVWAVANVANSPTETDKHKQGEPGQQQTCPLYSSADVRSCMVTETPTVFATAEPTTEGEFEFCFVGPIMTKQIGVNTFEFRSTKGSVMVQYKMIRRNSLANGKCPDKF